MLTPEDQIAGCLLGGALGDAVGSLFEGTKPQQELRWPAELRISDDTQLTIATCEAIIELRSVSPAAIADNFRRWFRQGRITGIGSSTLKALTELSAGGHWALVGASGERAAGNGAAMRVAPLAFFLDPDVDSQRQTIRDVCRITHRNDEAYIGALAVLRTLRHVIAGGRLCEDILTLLVQALPDSRVRDRLSDIRSSEFTVEEYARRFGASGYVVDSVPLAILAAIRSQDVLESIKEIARFGGDTDTIAAMCGQIVGAAHGTNCLPGELIDAIDATSLVRETAAKLARTSVAI